MALCDRLEASLSSGDDARRRLLDAAGDMERYALRFLLLEAGHLMQNLCLMSASLGLTTVPLGGYFEADLSVANKFRDELGSEPWKIGPDGCVRPLDKPGIGVEIDEKFLEAHPVIEGPGYV